MAPGAQVHRVQLPGSRRQDDRLPDDLHRLRLQRNRNEQRLTHHVLAGDHLLAAALLVKYQCRELEQRVARLLDRAAMGVDSGQLLDKSDVAVLGLEIHRSEGEASLFHFDSLCVSARANYATSISDACQQSVNTPPGFRESSPLSDIGRCSATQVAVQRHRPPRRNARTANYVTAATPFLR